MEINKHKNMITKTIWFKNETEYDKLISAIIGNEKEKVFDIIFEINKRGDL